MTTRGRIVWIVATAAVAAVVHVTSVIELPRFIMGRTLARMGTANTMHFSRRPDETSRGVVRPSPDLLYAACPFDLSNGPVTFVAHVPHSTYWSVSAFDSATNNFFVRDDRQIAGDSVEIVMQRSGMAGWPATGSTAERFVVTSPTTKGLLLVRLLIDDDRHLPALDAVRRQASCSVVRP